jgi:hypothetical protein
MKSKLIICTVLFLLCGRFLFAEIAIIPYKINSASIDFPEKMGGEYSRLLAVAATIAKEDIEVISPLDIDTDLEQLRLNPQQVITKDDLDLLGRSRRIDYFLTGSLTKYSRGYRSESVLYSVRDRKITARIRVESSDLYKLAEKEIRDAFVQYRNKTLMAGRKAMSMDAVFLLDTSYGMSHDWTSVKNAIVGFSSNSIDTHRIDTRIYLVPFSDRLSYSTSSVSTNSITDVRRALDNLSLAGGQSSEAFIKSLRYAVQEVRWRNAARKMIIIIADSIVSPGAGDKYAVLARNKGVSIASLALGKITGDRCEAFERLSHITGGMIAHAAYHQKLYDAKAESIELYLENGRLFKSNAPGEDWRSGLFVPKPNASGNGKPKSFLDEIFYSEKKFELFPHTMPEAYGRIAMERIINQEKIEDNTARLLDRVLGTGGKGKDEEGAIGKALISEGNISFWVYSNNPDDMAVLENARKSGFYILLGVTLKKDANAPYGVALIPLAANLGSGYVPELLKVRLSDIIGRSDYYMTRGLFFPPVWFVSVKVETTERLRGAEDIRAR